MCQRISVPLRSEDVGVTCCRSLRAHSVSKSCYGTVETISSLTKGLRKIPCPLLLHDACLPAQTGVAFCRDLSASSGRLGLASCRLLDNRQMRLGKALKGEQVKYYDYFPSSQSTILAYSCRA